MTHPVALDPRTLALAQALGIDAALGDSLADGRSASLLIAGPASIETLRAWRVQGVRTAAVLLLPPGAPAPDYRATLEPLAVAVDPTPDDWAHAVERLAAGAPRPRVRVARGVVDLERRELLHAEGTEPLSQSQADLLAYLVARAGRLVTQEELLAEVWGFSPNAQTRAVAMAVSRLRKLIEADPAEPRRLLTVRGEGFRFVVDESEGGPRLPEPPNAYVGRAALRAEVGALAARHRLVQLTGPPGIGKTRLALEVARAASDRPAAWVDLAGLADPAGLASAVAGALDLTLPPKGGTSTDAERLADGLAERGALRLVLDNAEPHTEAVSRLVDGLLALCPRLSVLVTGQEPLPSAAVQVVRVGPLDAPEAEALFRARAEARGARDVRDDHALRALLDLLDGLPLAIELAAARVVSTPVANLVAQLGDTPPENVGWAIDRLDPSTRDALAALAQFRGPFDRTAATEVAESETALDALVLRSLVLHQDGRYRLLVPVRALARRLPLPADAAERWLGAMARLARVEAERARTVEARDALRRLALAQEDLLAALDVTVARRDPRAAPLALALEAVLATHGTARDRLAVLDRAVEALEPEHPLAAARVRLVRSQALKRLDFARGDVDAQAAVALAREAGDPQVLGQALVNLAWFDYRTSRDRTNADEALAWCRAHGPKASLYAAEVLVAGFDSRVDPSQVPRTRGLNAARVARFRELGDLREALDAANAEALGLSAQGDPRTAQALRELRALLELIPHREIEANAANVEAYMRLDEGRYDEALACFERYRQLCFGRSGTPDGAFLMARGIGHADARMHVEAQNDFDQAMALLVDHGMGTMVAGLLEVYASCQLDAGLLEHGLELASRASAMPSVAALVHHLALRTHAIALHLLGDLDGAGELLGRVEFTRLSPHHTQEIGLAKAALARETGNDAALRRALDVVRGALQDDFHATCARAIADALERGDADRLLALATGRAEVLPLAALRVAARAAHRAVGAAPAKVFG